MALLVRRRNEILVRWGRTRGFDFLFTLQRLTHLLRNVFMGLVAVLALPSWILSSFLHLLNTNSPEFLGITTAIIVLYLGRELLAPLSEIFLEPTLSVLCLRNFVDKVTRKRDISRRQLVQGLKKVEIIFAKYGIGLPHERLAFALNLNLLRGISIKDPLNNLVKMLERPTSGNLTNAVNSSKSILESTRDDLALGMEIPLPFWKRLLIPPYLEFVGSVIYFVIFVVTAALLLLGFRL